MARLRALAFSLGCAFACVANAQPSAADVPPPPTPPTAAVAPAAPGDAPSAAVSGDAPAPPPPVPVEPAPAPPPPPAQDVSAPTPGPPAVVTAPPPAADAEQLAVVESDAEVRTPHAERRCLLGGFCIGPVLTLGILDAFGIGAQARTDHWGIAFDYQFLKFTTQQIPITLSLLTVESRLYPFAGVFFVSAGVAWQHASLSRHVSYAGGGGVPAFEADVAGRINIPVLKLGLGVMGRSGFVLGVDLAFGIQLGGNTVELESSLPRVDDVIAAENKVRDRADKFVRALPFLLQLNLIRLGFLF